MDLFKLLGRIVVNNSEANTAIDETTDKASGMANAFGEAGSDVSRAGGGIGSAVKKVGAVVATYLTVDAIKNFGMGCIQAAADASAANSQFSQVFGELEGTASKSLKGIAKTAGISETRMKGSYTQIAAFAKTTGMDTETALGLADRAMVAVADSAAFYDRSLEETTESLQSFLKGNYENDAALGLSCTETTRNAAANKLYGKSFKDLSEEQKQLTLLKMVEEANELSGAMGQAARESNTWTNQTGNLRQAWTDFQAVLGQPIVGIATNAVGWLAEKIQGLMQKITEGTNPVQWMIDKISALGSWFSKVGWYAKYVLAEPLEDLKGIFSTVKDAVGGVIKRFAAFVTSSKTTKAITQGVYNAISWLADAYSVAKSYVQAFVDGLPDYITNGQLVKDITDGIKDAIGFLQEKFTAVKEALQPYIDQLADYLTNGQAAEDITNAVKTAVEVLSTAYEGVSGFIANVVQGFKDAVEWGKEHETALTLIGIALGTLTAAIGAYNIAMAIKNAGGIAELVQLGILQVQLWALTAAQAAHTLATNIATAATSAFGAVMAFVTSPITLVVAAIGALIAIGVLLYQNWDVIKAKCLELWTSVSAWFGNLWSDVSAAAQNIWQSVTTWFSNLKTDAVNAIMGLWSSVTTWFSNLWSSTSSAAQNIWSSVTTWFSNLKTSVVNYVMTLWSSVTSYFSQLKQNLIDAASNIWSNVTSKFTNLKTSLVNAAQNIWSSITTKFEQLKTSVVNVASTLWTNVTAKFNQLKTSLVNAASDIWSNISSKFTNLKTSVVNTASNIWTSVTSKFTSLKTSATQIFQDVKDSIVGKIQDAKDKISGVISSITGLFTGASFSWPKIPMPHFAITPSGWKVGDLLEGSIPKLGISWYAKAMNNPLLLNEPTVFGYDAASGNLLGGGEAGAEVVAGANTLMGMISNAVTASSAAHTERVVAVLAAILEAITGGNQEVVQALLAGQTIALDRREFGRLVKQYA